MVAVSRTVMRRESDIDLFRQQVSYAAKRMDGDIRFDRFKSSSQPRNQCLDRVWSNLAADPVNGVLEQPPRHDLAGAAHQQLERIEFAARDHDHAVVDLELP